jgi:hypothetical protein
MKSESVSIANNSNKDTCPRYQGCCKCADSAPTKPETPEISEREIEEGDRFENTVPNTVFVTKYVDFVEYRSRIRLKLSLCFFYIRIDNNSS